VTLKAYSDASHAGVLADKRVLKDIAGIATQRRKSAPWIDIGRLLSSQSAFT
jgi:hypothetical protein